jgi:hypothetical protein
MCHPDRTLSDPELVEGESKGESKGEWRDLLFAWVSDHAARSDLLLRTHKLKARIGTPTPPQGFFFPLLLNPASPPLVDACATLG